MLLRLVTRYTASVVQGWTSVLMNVQERIKTIACCLLLHTKAGSRAGLISAASRGADGTHAQQGITEREAARTLPEVTHDSPSSSGSALLGRIGPSWIGCSRPCASLLRSVCYNRDY